MFIPELSTSIQIVFVIFSAIGLIALFLTLYFCQDDLPNRNHKYAQYCDLCGYYHSSGIGDRFTCAADRCLGTTNWDIPF